jgi:hypothetical protein
MQTRSSANDGIRQLTPRILSARFGATERWWQRYLPELCKQGKIGKRGRLFFGRLDVIAEWLVSDPELPWTETHEENPPMVPRRPTPRRTKRRGAANEWR